MTADADAIEFGTDGWRATLDTFTTPRVRMVGQAVATYLREERADESTGGETPTVAVGYDARDTSPEFAEELARVFAANGFNVLVPERDLPTPVVAWTVRERGLAGGLMITASHNPPEYNGVKFIPAGGAPALPEVTDALADRLAEPDPLPEDEWGTVEETDLVSPYTDHVVDAVDADLSGVSVVYDAMHGSGRGVTDAILEGAGADVERRRCDRDPEFGGESPEPSGERLGPLADRVAETDADLGVANDGDADRVAVVTSGRGVLDPNLFFAATYDALLDGEFWSADEVTSDDVVRTVSTSSIVDRVAEAHGAAVHETAVGFKWVAEAMGEHDALVGGEESGGFGLTAHVRNKDGVAVALLAAAIAADTGYDERVAALLDRHGDIVQDRVSVDCPDDRKDAVLADLEDALPDELAGSAVESVSTVDGFKVFLADGTWLLMRPSGTEPKLRVYAEAGSQERADELLDAGRGLVEPLV
ncbi:phosphoglucomutase/phosphomannomutase family protein [Halosimplex salinum]|uniref:phosphoglucomutase/phosphomannomutase family protein n=1 Tax=Halosimplex salinum TaxID=1710538 RepID=UPI000F48E169|nr:phosphoglucomutase/phosphomannomutase family protein [Halosimplex salinum]